MIMMHHWTRSNAGAVTFTIHPNLISTPQSMYELKFVTVCEKSLKLGKSLFELDINHFEQF